MTIVPTLFLSGFTTDGHGSVVARKFYIMKQKKDGIYRKRTPHPLNHTPKKYNSFGLSTSLGSLVGSTVYKIIYLMHFHFLWSIFMRSNGEMNTKPNYAVKRMWSISAKPK